MLTPQQQSFLNEAHQAAIDAGHIFPAVAACEAALESRYGQSKLAVEANNLFGQKQSHPPLGETLSLPTEKYLKGQWVTVNADWVKFPKLADSFAARMALLRRLAPAYPHYANALVAKTEPDYITEVSASWSTDPNRASNVLMTWKLHFGPNSV
jgi:flagellum-specific peptidoglycan hydrolase FlgJ